MSLLIKLSIMITVVVVIVLTARDNKNNPQVFEEVKIPQTRRPTEDE